MTFEKVKEIMVETINCDAEKITMEANLKENLGVDSLDAMELSMALEEAFDIEIEEEALQNFDTVEKIVTYIENKVA